MLLPLTLCLINVVLVESFILPDSYNIALRDSAKFEVGESFDASKYETISNEELNRFGLDNKENNLHEMKRLAGKYQKTTAAPRDHTTKTSVRAWKSKTHSPRKFPKKSTVPPLTKHPMKRESEISETTVRTPNYNYKEMLYEYYAESIQEGKYKKTYHAQKKEKSANELLNSLEILVPVDIDKNVKKGTQLIEQRDTAALVEMIWRFTKILLIVYIVLAIPLWCTKGWCCCCLFCKLFKPRRTIDEAKKYLVRNPPGVYFLNKREKQYHPTNEEKDSYEEFEHLVRTM